MKKLLAVLFSLILSASPVYAGASFGDGGSSSDGAPTNATYITQTANGSLSAEQALSALSTGIMRVATATGAITSLTDSAGIAANISDETGTGSLVFSNSPTLVTPALGTPASGVMTNVTGIPVSALANGTDGELITWGADAVATTVAVGSAGQVLTSNGAGAAPTFQAAGTGDITDVWSVTSGDANQPVIGTGEFLDGGTATADGTNEGILLPRGTSIGATTQGQIAYNTTTKEVHVGDGSSALRINRYPMAAVSATSQTGNFVMGPGSAEGEHQHYPTTFKCTNLVAQVDTAPGAGKSWTINTCENGGCTSKPTCTISDTNTSCTDDSTVGTFTADTGGITFDFTASGGPTGTAGQSVAVMCWEA